MASGICQGSATKRARNRRINRRKPGARAKAAPPFGREYSQSYVPASMRQDSRACSREPTGRRDRRSLLPRGRRSRLGAEAGFTLLETLIASVVLIVGLMTLFGLLETSLKATASTRAREGATNLAREVLEDARTLAFAQISPTSIVGTLQAMHGLENVSGGAAWQIRRRGVLYTVTVKECALDDPKDGFGVHENALTKENPFCKDAGEEAGTADSAPEDFKRITAEVAWTATGRKPLVKQVETLTAAGEAPGLSASQLKLIKPTVGAPTAPVIVAQPAESKLTFSIQSPLGTKALEWSLDGVRQTNEPALVSGTEWQFSWLIPTPEVSDGAYRVSVQAVDTTGVYGPPVSITVTLIRSVPAAPKITYAGFNELYVSGVKKKVVELQWQPNTERNVIGYRVYNPSGGLVCPKEEAILSLEAACIDFGPPEASATNLTYSVRALYRAAEGEALSKTVISQGPAASVALSKSPSAPGEMKGPLTAEKTAEGAVVLKWTTPEGGAAPVFYRVYRGSKNYPSRYAIVSSAVTEFTDTHAESAHEYWVTAVSASMTESPFLGAVGPI
jgi:type II secretory pathway pseudopilin PulG